MRQISRLFLRRISLDEHGFDRYVEGLCQRFYAGRPAFLLLHRSIPIQREVQLEHVDPCFAQETELPSFGVGQDNMAKRVFGHPSFMRHARDLEIRRGGSDVRVDAGRGRRHEVDRHRDIRVLFLRRFNVGRDGLDQFLVRRSQLATAGVGRVVRRRRCGRPRPEVSR